MKLKKVLAVSLAAAMTLSMAACGGSSSDSSAASDDATTGSVAATTTESGDAAETTDGALNYASIKLGEDYTDITTTIHVFNQRTDMSEDSYPGKNWEAYIADFNEMYPNITVEVETDTNYSDDSLLRLQSGDWGDIMMIPAVDKADLSEYFLPYGTLDEMEGQIKFANTWDYDGLVYGVPSTGNAQGIVYNKRVFTEAGVAETPKTPDEFIAALQAIKDYDSSIIPLYTNYADGWPMEQWDGQIAGTTTGDSTYMNQKLLHTKDPFQDYGDNTHPYALYKVLYDAVADGLTEDDFTTTSWEDSKGMINRGEIATMVLGSWAYSQMVDADSHGEDIGYMPFPITIDGKQYASAGADYSFGINAASDADHQAAAMVFVKWMTEESGFAYNEGGIPIAADDNDYPDAYAEFGDVTFVSDESALEGEEDLLNALNADSGLNINAGGKEKVQEYASAGADYSFGINAASDADHQAAAMVFVKWMTEESGFAYNEGGIPIAADDNDYPDAYAEFGDVTFVSDESALEGEEDLLNALNADSGLNINAGGKEKVQEIIEHASNGDMSYDDIMAEWNEKWTQAQEDNGVTAE